MISQRPKATDETLAAENLPMRLFNWLGGASSRRDLKALTDDQLRDVGLTRHAVEAAADKPFWTVGAGTGTKKERHHSWGLKAQPESS